MFCQVLDNSTKSEINFYQIFWTSKPFSLSFKTIIELTCKPIIHLLKQLLSGFSTCPTDFP